MLKLRTLVGHGKRIRRSINPYKQQRVASEASWHCASKVSQTPSKEQA